MEASSKRHSQARVLALVKLKTDLSMADWTALLSNSYAFLPHSSVFDFLAAFVEPAPQPPPLPQLQTISGATEKIFLPGPHLPTRLAPYPNHSSPVLSALSTASLQQSPAAGLTQLLFE